MSVKELLYFAQTFHISYEKNLQIQIFHPHLLPSRLGTYQILSHCCEGKY